MRINDTNYGFYSYQKQLNRKNTENITKKSSSSSAEVEISSRGKEISQAAMSEQAQRQKRVQELKQQINNGTYQVDSKKVAEKMIDFWK
ncbi:flagellar biosynthesis anti-sigma factor FlgM [Neobacillus niacini]|uniref:flagellar biosynthesis anti-sigma factor FlgM n=1 Tax=Neobacillus niacini TaxID=86668 RepID=UPI0028603F8D|nr:flagellar biosynthesis anti-sigma factor FlgM [Neobacillus niacini]MDR7000979.1 negative regulator of flagellin synthesis FlgM [Neobacillus niacini]